MPAALDPDLKQTLLARLRFYRDLGRSEERHFELYLGFAQAAAPAQWQERLAVLAAHEAQLATAPDHELRFHSGPPA